MRGSLKPCAVIGALLSAPLAGSVTAQEAVMEFGLPEARQIVLRSTTDIAVLRPAMELFVRENPDISVLYEQWGSNDLYFLSQLECADGESRADAVLSSGVHQMVDLVNAHCATPYSSSLTEALLTDRIWRNEVWGVTREAAVIVYNTERVAEEDVPRSRFGLLDLMRRDTPHTGKIATYDIEASGLGYLFAFSDSLEASTFGAMLEGFARVDAVATCCSATIIEGVSSGRYHMAYNVLGSYAGTVGLDNLAIVRPEDYTLYLSRAFLIPRTAPSKPEAGRLLDFFLSAQGRAVLENIGLWDEGSGEVSASRGIGIDPTLLIALDQQRRTRFISQWRATFGPKASP